MFTKEQIAFMESMGLKLDFSCLSGEDYIKIEDVVGDAYTAEVQKHEKELTQTISMCESILDNLG